MRVSKYKTVVLPFILPFILSGLFIGVFPPINNARADGRDTVLRDYGIEFRTVQEGGTLVTRIIYGDRNQAYMVMGIDYYLSRGHLDMTQASNIFGHNAQVNRGINEMMNGTFFNAIDWGTHVNLQPDFYTVFIRVFTSTGRPQYIDILKHVPFGLAVNVELVLYILGVRHVGTARDGITFAEFLERDPPLRTGYTFAGWFHDAALTQRVLATDVISGNTVIHARMDRVSGGSNPPPNPPPDNGDNPPPNPPPDNNNSNNTNGTDDEDEGFELSDDVIRMIVIVGAVAVGLIVLIAVSKSAKSN